MNKYSPVLLDPSYMSLSMRAETIGSAQNTIRLQFNQLTRATRILLAFREPSKLPRSGNEIDVVARMPGARAPPPVFVTSSSRVMESSARFTEQLVTESHKRSRFRSAR
ncbi:hypothetical protein EVAR_58094_1 [Eumeta japonica]|uniref:Uncharacterized protein n=1 Tax=Eumeta variegata TaxID=151549 RepID=A0A4C1YKD3_EUMVA|nr:hypothetical protein EVAR_58094_1 [Eumeta japonica]